MTISYFRCSAPLLLLLLAACSDSSDPWSRIANPPLIQGKLHTVTIVGDSSRAQELALAAGYSALPLRPNYPASVRVEASLWDVPGPVAESARMFEAPGESPDLRILEMPLAARGIGADDHSERSFYRNVLGSEVPRSPAEFAGAPEVRVRAWTFVVPSVVEASKRLRENGIAVIYDAVGITTPYLGDHKTMAVRAPDGTIVQLVESRAQ